MAASRPRDNRQISLSETDSALGPAPDAALGAGRSPGTARPADFRLPASPPARPTMRDVAALAGVSLKTVSRVINGEPTVDPALAARVQRAAGQLSYRHNLTASNLRRGDGRSFMIGLMLEDVANPYSSSIYRAVENVARHRGVGVLAGSLDEDPDRERELAAALFARRVDGLIVVPAGRDHSYLRHDQELGTALVFVDRPPELLPADSVMADNREGATAGVAHLIGRGHRRIAFLSDLTSIRTAQDRYQGYLDALRAAGIAPDPAAERRDLHTAAAAEAAAVALLTGPQPPTALFSAQNLVTMGTVRALRACGLQHRVALVGFDDFTLADLLEPGVTVVAQDVAAIGSLAAEILFARIDGDAAPPRARIVATRLIQRGSGEIPPGYQP
jgi:LacI family transcriptional regulator